MASDPTTANGDHLDQRILGLVRESGRVSLSEIRRRLDGYSLDNIVKGVNRLHQAHLVRLDMAHDDYDVVLVKPMS